MQLVAPKTKIAQHLFGNWPATDSLDLCVVKRLSVDQRDEANNS